MFCFVAPIFKEKKTDSILEAGHKLKFIANTPQMEEVFPKIWQFLASQYIFVYIFPIYPEVMSYTFWVIY